MMNDLIHDPAMLRAYEQHEKTASDYTSGINAARREGEQNKAMAIARNMKVEGDSNEKIARITGLSLEEIERLIINDYDSAPAMLRAYEQHEKAASDYTSGINAARREGEQNKAIAIDGNMKSKGKAAGDTGLSLEELRRLIMNDYDDDPAMLRAYEGYARRLLRTTSAA